jgi:MOSC domain-containing protein YiiM
MGDPVFPSRFAAANRPGAYLRIVEAGDAGAGDTVDILDRPAHGVTVAEVSRALLGERSLWPHVLRATRLPAGQLETLRARLDAEGAVSEAPSG